MPKASTKNAPSPQIMDKKAAFEEALKKLNKEIPSDTGQVIAKLSERPMDVKTISTGSVVLDSICGGGYPVGRLIEIYGAESSGKTTMALIAAAQVQSEGGNVAFIDLENALDPRYARTLGVNTDDLAVSQPDYAEQALRLVGLLAASATVDLIIVDSIASLVPKAELEGDLEQQTIGLVARLMSRALKQLATIANRTQTTIIFINQTRDAIGTFSMYGTPQTTSGGKAMKFYASMRIEVKRGKPIVEGKEAAGVIMKLKIVKNKIAPPFREGESILTFNKGINLAAEMVEVGPKYGIIERPSTVAYVEAETGQNIANGKEKAIKAIEADPALLERLSKALAKALKENLDNMDEVVEDEEESEDDLLDLNLDEEAATAELEELKLELDE